MYTQNSLLKSKQSFPNLIRV